MTELFTEPKYDVWHKKIYNCIAVAFIDLIQI